MKMMTDEDVRAAERFIAKVQAMREAQKNYFHTRDGMSKAHAMMLEREVDYQLDAWEMERVRAEGRQKYPELFPAE
jgi:hypothetical protein